MKYYEVGYQIPGHAANVESIRANNMTNARKQIKRMYGTKTKIIYVRLENPGFKGAPKQRNPKGARSYVGVVEEYVAGQPVLIKSGRFKRKQDAIAWAKNKARGIARRGKMYALHIDKPPEIGPGPKFELLNPGSTKALATAYAAKGGRITNPRGMARDYARSTRRLSEARAERDIRRQWYIIDRGTRYTVTASNKDEARDKFHHELGFINIRMQRIQPVRNSGRP